MTINRLLSPSTLARLALVLFVWLALSAPLVASAQTDSANLLTNPSLERPYYGQGDAARTVPNGWQLWVGMGAPQSFPHNERPQVREGDVAWKMNQAGTVFTAAAFQRVTGIQPGTVLRATAHGWVFTCADAGTGCVISEAPFRRSDRSAGAELRVGLDPTGNIDPDAGTVVWSDAAAPYDAWEMLTLTVTAQADAVTIFLYATQARGLAINDVYWDSVELVPTGDRADATRTPATRVAPSATPVIVEQGSVQPDGSLVHEVGPGDTLVGIVQTYRQYGASLELIDELNEDITATTRFLQLGQQIIILPPGSVDPATNALITPTPVVTATPTPTSSETPAPPTATDTAAPPTASATPAPSATPSPTQAATLTATETLTETPGATTTPTTTPAPSETPPPTQAATLTATPTPTPTDVPPTGTPLPSAEPLVLNVEPGQGAVDALVADGARLCVTIYQDEANYGQRDEGEILLAGSQVTVDGDHSAPQTVAYDGSADPLCLDVAVDRYHVQAVPPNGYGMTTPDLLGVTLTRGQTVSLVFGGALGYLPPRPPERDPALAQAGTSIPPDAAAPLYNVEVSPADSGDDGSALDSLLDNVGLLVLAVGGVVLIGGTLAIVLLRRP